MSETKFNFSTRSSTAFCFPTGNDHSPFQKLMAILDEGLGFPLLENTPESEAGNCLVTEAWSNCIAQTNLYFTVDIEPAVTFLGDMYEAAEWNRYMGPCCAYSYSEFSIVLTKDSDNRSHEIARFNKVSFPRWSKIRPMLCAG
jgi:hypothetical protein